MQLGINVVGYNQNFGGVKMTSKNRKDATKLLNMYYDTPTLKIRDELFEILDPYMQRHAKEIASDTYYYDDVLQNMRLNFFSLLEDFAYAKQCSNNKISSKAATSIADFKTKLVHTMDHLKDAKIPQKDESLVSWNRMSHKQQEALIPADRLEKQDVLESYDMFVNDTDTLTRAHKYVIEARTKEDRSFDEIAAPFLLTGTRVRQIFDKAIGIIRKKHKIEPNNIDFQMEKLNEKIRRDRFMDWNTKVQWFKKIENKSISLKEKLDLIREYDMIVSRR